MACASLTAIAEDCGLNPGGAKPYFLIAAKEDIETIPAATNEVITTAITMVTDKVFVKWDLDPDSVEMKVKTEGEGLSKSIMVEIEAFLPRLTAPIQAAIKLAIGRQLVIVLVDAQGRKRLIGDVEKGAFCDFEANTGKKGSDKAGHLLKFTLSGQDHAPYHITSSIPIG